MPDIVTVQLSVAAGGVHTAVALHPASADTVMFAGQPVMTGGVISFTVTTKAQVDVFPYGSDAVYVTCVSPRKKISPGLYDEVKELTAQLSVAVGAVQLTAIEQEDDGKFTVKLTGQLEITGGTVSIEAGRQQIIAPFLLVADITVKFPLTLPG